MESLGLMPTLSHAFKGRAVLITGHTGFKGSWLALWLAHLGAKVYGYSLPPPTEPSNFVASNIHELLARHQQADVRDRNNLLQYIREVKPDIIFHLAAQPLVRDSYQIPIETLETNVMGTANILDAVRLLAQPCIVIIVTSDKCYDNHEQVWGYRESDALGGHDVYSASKGAAEIVTAAYRRSFFSIQRIAEHGVQVASVRAGNVIGGGDWAKDRILSDIVRCLYAGEAIPVRNPQAIRPWQHVLEPLSGYLLLAARMIESSEGLFCESWNFGPFPGEEITVGQLVNLFVKAFGRGTWKDVSDPRQPHEAAVLRLNIDKAIWKLGWKPRWLVHEAVARTAKWFLQFHQTDHSMRDACLQDIKDYESSSIFENKERVSEIGQTDSVN